jgi:4-hydroxy-tetrahydrodipicolinate reductase
LTPIKVVVHGAAGRMGQEILNGLHREPGIQVVGAVDVKVAKDTMNFLDGSGAVPFSTDLDKILHSTEPDVVVDFSLVKATIAAVPVIASHGVDMVIGTTGLTPTDIEEIGRQAEKHNVGIVVAPNFALGAVLMIHLAKIAAKYMDYAEITELHHNTKADAPSGTALSTARAMVQSKGKPFTRDSGQFPSRGQNVDGVSIHSVRLPGMMAHQEVLFGASGQTLSIRHDTINRECYLPGIVIAVKEVVKRKGLTYGLDALLNL